jgi:hypothetical protein
MHRTTFSAVNPAGQIPPMPRGPQGRDLALVASILQEYYGAIARYRDQYFYLISKVTQMRRLSRGYLMGVGLMMVAGAWGDAAIAQKLVDPNAVAPEFRDAAEKRRAEQIKLVQCNKKADESKVLRRDRAAFVGDCLEH